LIDPRAVIHPDTSIADDVEVGPFTVIGPNVEIGAGSKIHSHALIKGPTTIGCNNTIFQFASVGEDCQDLKYSGEPTCLRIGDNNIIRENCTIHRGTVQDNSLTSIGNNNVFMAYVHIAHDCVIGNHCIFSNNATLAGHVKVGDHVILGGFAGVHQFCTIGSYSMMRGASSLFMDLPAYIMVSGNPAKATGMNYEGMRRRGWPSETINALRKAYKVVYRQGHLITEAIEILDEMSIKTPEVKLFADSLRQAKRGIVR